MTNSDPDSRIIPRQIASEEIATKNKVLFLELKENRRGRFLTITEDRDGRRNSIRIRGEAFSAFVEAVRRLVKFESELSADSSRASGRS
jgi:hypothetical protein